METDYSNQPDTLILTAECDPLRDEGEEYGRRLKEAGNQVEIHRIQDALQSTETLITVQNFASLFRETELRTHEYQFKCGYVVRQMLSSVICHIVLYRIV